MSKNYKDLACNILNNVGGANNINTVYHCATRLRFTLNDSKLVKRDELEKLSGVLSILGSGTQLQVVIGNSVNSVYNELTILLPVSNDVQVKSDGKDGKITEKVFNVISGIFAPYLPLIMCSGILKGVLTLLVSSNILSNTSGTYAILSAAGNVAFYFFPILLSYTAAKQFNTNPFVAIVIGATLLEPNFTGLAAIGSAVDFLGIPVVVMNYGASVIPAILGVWLFSVIDHKLKPHLPESIQSTVTTLIGMLVVVPLTVLIFGPFGVYMSQFLGDALNALVGFNGLLAGIIAGGFCGYLAIFGLQWGIIPIIIMNINNVGFDLFTPMWLMATYSQVALALGVMIKSKHDKAIRQLAVSSFLTGILTGITEPIIYGLLTKYKRLHIPFIVAGAVSGGFVGAMGVKQYSFVFGGILNFPGFFGDTFPFYIAGIIIALVIGTVLVVVIGYEDKDSTTKKNLHLINDVDFISPLEGEIIQLSEVKDEAFASGLMGDGLAIIPRKGIVVSPMDGIVAAVFPTGHAYGITCDNGAEVLIHIGFDTVKLGGKYFNVKVKVDQKVKKGEVLVEFDLDAIKQAGYDVTTPIIITNASEFNIKDKLQTGEVLSGNKLLTISK